jgi:streptogramin lyase
MRRTRLLLTALAFVVCAPLAGAGSEPDVVPTGEGPCGISARAGSLWVGVYGAGKVLSIDPTSGHVNASIPRLSWACRIAVGPAAIWVTRDRAGEVIRISRGSGRRRHVRVGAGAFDVLLASGHAWVPSAEIGVIAQLDAATGRGLRIYRDGTFPAGVTSCGGRVWVGHGRGATWLTAITPPTHRMRRFDVGARAPAWPRCVRGELWVTTTDSVLRVDPGSGAVRARIHLGGTPVEAAAGPDGLVWVTDKERSLVFRIDPAANSVVDSFAAGPGAYAMAPVGRSMWITSYAGSDVRRFER